MLTGPILLLPIATPKTQHELIDPFFPQAFMKMDVLPTRKCSKFVAHCTSYL